MNINDLRPSFFRFGAGRSYSGWWAPTGDYWATSETVHDARRMLNEEGHKALAVELMSSTPNEHGLHLVIQAVPALLVGERIEFSRNVDLHPLTYIYEGERCVVGRDCRTSGSVDLFMTNYHKRLDDSSNCITIEPHLCDDVLSALRLFVDDQWRIRDRLLALTA